MDEEVHGFVVADKNVPPINATARRETPYPNNGWANPSLVQKNDMAEPGYKPSVYGFTSDLTETLPWVRNDLPYPANGEKSGWALSQ